MSHFSNCVMDFAIILLAVSPIPIGRTPGFFERAIRRLANSGVMECGSTYVEQILLATSASDSQRSLDGPL